MPKVQASADELRDLLAYLTRLTADRSPRATLPGTAAATATDGTRFADIARPKPGEWPTYHGQLSGNRHSPLDQINRTNVARLAPKWTFQVPGARGALQVTPVVVDGLMYVTAANAVWALDARTGRQVWHYSRPRTSGLVGDPASGINRGVAVLGDRVFLQTDHAHLVALHRMSGQLLWDAEMADYREHYGATSAPLVVNDLVIAGVSGGDEGNRGFLDAYRASTGERVWRFWTVPARGEPGAETWIGKALEHGCAATWLTGTYDPEARLLYWPTGNPCPDYNGDERKGDNLYSNSVLALDPDTGKLKWHFQFTPHDLHDWDATETPMLVDTAFRGRPRKLLLHGDRNGFFYVLDRLTGELLLAEPFVNGITWASGIGKDGRPVLLPGNEPTAAGTRTCPSVAGATNWPSMAFSPITGLFYLMTEESCSIYTKSSEWWVQGQSFYGGGTRQSPGDVSRKFLRALDVQTGRIAWEIPDLGGGILASGLMSTAGGLVFYGDSPGGAFIAADAKTGGLLWHFNTGQSWKAGPMTYAHRRSAIHRDRRGLDHHGLRAALRCFGHPDRAVTFRLERPMRKTPSGPSRRIFLSGATAASVWFWIPKPVKGYSPAELRAMTVNGTVKGVSKWDLDTPALCVDLDVMEKNIATMQSALKKYGLPAGRTRRPTSARRLRSISWPRGRSASAAPSSARPRRWWHTGSTRSS